jgi:hypothetical protein
LVSLNGHAEVFKMSCEVEGTIEQLDDKKFVPAKVVIEIQSIGKNIFINLTGPKLYEIANQQSQHGEVHGQESHER